MEGEDNKQRIIEKAIEMFNSYGCKGVTMDQIASSMRISKRTLYETFANKEALLFDCLTEVHRRIGKKHLEVYNQTAEPLLLTIHIIKSTMAYGGRYGHLLQDSERYYPEINNAILDRFINKLREVLHKILSQAAKEGDIHSTVDIDVAVNTIITTINRLYQSGHSSDQSYVNTLKDSIYTYLRGLLSLPAIKRYDEREQEFKALLDSQDFKQ